MPVYRFAGAAQAIRKLVGDEIAGKLGPVWDLDEQGEQRGAWRWLGMPNLWFMMGAWRSDAMCCCRMLTSDVQATCRCAASTRSTLPFVSAYLSVFAYRSADRHGAYLYRDQGKARGRVRYSLCALMSCVWMLLLRLVSFCGIIDAVLYFV